jgi:hypothetical protein
VRAWAAVALLLLASVLLAGCGSGGRNELTVTVSNPTPHDAEVWLRIESVRGDVKHNEPVQVPAGEVVDFSMGDLQGMIKFTTLVLGHSHSEVEQMEPDEDWTVDLGEDGSTCFFFGVSPYQATGDDARCG